MKRPSCISNDALVKKKLKQSSILDYVRAYPLNVDCWKEIIHHCCPEKISNQKSWRFIFLTGNADQIDSIRLISKMHMNIIEKSIMGEYISLLSEGQDYIKEDIYRNLKLILLKKLTYFDSVWGRYEMTHSRKNNPCNTCKYRWGKIKSNEMCHYDKIHRRYYVKYFEKSLWKIIKKESSQWESKIMDKSPLSEALKSTNTKLFAYGHCIECCCEKKKAISVRKLGS